MLVLDKRDPNGTGNETPVDLELQAKADTFLCPVYDVNKMMYFNGNDAVTLEKFGGVEIMDILFHVGPADPGNGWTNITDTTIIYNNGGVPTEYTIEDYIVGPLFWLSWTKDQTLIRKENIMEGVFDNPDVFNVSIEWDSIPSDSFENLGFHICDCNISIDFTVEEPVLCQQETAVFQLENNGYEYDSLVWLFPSGIPEISFSTNPMIVYNEIGEFDVTMKVFLGADSVIIERENLIQVLALPEIPAKPFGTEFVCFNVGQSEYYTNLNSVVWELNPPDAGNISFADSTCQINWNNEFSGPAALKAKSINECGESPFSDELLIEVSRDSIHIEMNEPELLCPNEPVVLQPQASGGFSPYSFVWEPASLFDDPLSETPVFSAPESTSVSLTITDEMGCSINRGFFILIDPADYGLAFDAFPTEFTEEPFNVQFNNLTPDADNYDFVWYFGIGDSASAVQPNYTYTANGLYTITLVATNKLTGCSDTLVMEDMITCTDASDINELGLEAFKYWIYQDSETLVFDFKDHQQEVQIQLFDVFWHCLFSDAAKHAVVSVPLIGISGGVYIFTVEDDGSIYSGKIVWRK